MKKYISLYQKLIKLNIARLMEYRANFINSVISDLGWGTFSILMMVILTSKTTTVFGWSRVELLILSGCVNIFFGIFRSIFSSNFETIGVSAKFGKLDSLLIKPVNSQFLISLTYINPTGFLRVILGSVFVSYLLFVNHISISPISIVFFILFLLMGIILLYAFCFSILTLTIWFPDLTNIIGLLYAVDSTVRYPQEMYRTMGSFFFLVLPLTFVVVPAVQVLLGKARVEDVIGSIFFTVVFLLFSMFFWHYALRSYTSVSS